MCAYKECEYLEECILSLEHQTVKAKIIISTSTPNDYIYSIASAHHIEVRVNSDGGQIKDYNFALKQADTKLVMLMHQDEVLAERFVETILNRINLSKHPIIIFTNYLEMHHAFLFKSGEVLLKSGFVSLKAVKSKKFYYPSTSFFKHKDGILQMIYVFASESKVLCIIIFLITNTANLLNF